jgi:hypothetical protein
MEVNPDPKLRECYISSMQGVVPRICSRCYPSCTTSRTAAAEQHGTAQSQNPWRLQQQPLQLLQRQQQHQGVW